MSSNRITANEASNLANSSVQFDKDYIVDQIYKTVKANPKSGNAVVLFDKKTVSSLEMEAAVRHLQADGYQVALAGTDEHVNFYNLSAKWPV